MLFVGNVQIPKTDEDNITELHRHVMRLFPQADVPARSSLGVLFQVLSEEDSGLDLLILSKTEPKAGTSGFASIPSPEFEEGDSLVVTLDANMTKRLPTSKTPERTSRHGRLAAIETVREMREWLDRKARQHGFSVLSAAFRPAPLAKRRGDNGLFLLATRVEAEVEITDAGLFSDAVANGIGRGRAFGCGLVNVFDVL